MHELGIATEAHRICRASVPAGHRLVRVELAVGELSAVEPELLRYAWESVVAGTPDEPCALTITWCPAQQTCSTCGVIEERVSGSWLKLCPKCERPLRVQGGQELDVVRVEGAPATTGEEQHS